MFMLAAAVGVFSLGSLCTAECAYAAETPQFSQSSVKGHEEYTLFTNYMDGYSLYLDSNLSVDTSMSEVVTVFENNNKRIEIYKQYVGNTGKSSYINYSNGFLNNKFDHKLDFSGVQTFNGNTAYLTMWHRDKLSRVANDKNYYAIIDIPKGNYCYTISIKANAPIGNVGGYTYLIESFKTFEPTSYADKIKTNKIDVDEKNWNDETKAFYNYYFADDAELTWGIFDTGFAYGIHYDVLDGYEDHFEYEFPVLLVYNHFVKDEAQYPKLKPRLEKAYERGKALELTLQTVGVNDGNMIYDILQGEYDDFLNYYAQTIADFGHPVLFRLGNEMNGDWCPYSSYNTSRDTVLFNEFYKYVRSFFDVAGAQNVIWVWNPNHDSLPNFKWNHSMMYYPGDEYVDVIGLTAYNTGTYYASIGESWKEFTELYDVFYYDYCERFEQPFMITEFACASMGGDKNQWVINMFNSIHKYDRIKIAVWWDGCDWDANGNIARSYFIDETPTLMDTFRKYLRKENYKAWYNDVFA